MLQKALGIFERTGETENINVAALLQRLGDTYYARNEYKQSEACFRRSIGILEKLLGPDHYHLVDTFSMLGQVAYDAGDYAKTEAMFQRALAITEKALGPDNLKVADKLDSLAMLYSTTGDYAKAEISLPASAVNPRTTGNDRRRGSGASARPGPSERCPRPTARGGKVSNPGERNRGTFRGI